MWRPMRVNVAFTLCVGYLMEKEKKAYCIANNNRCVTVR